MASLHGTGDGESVQATCATSEQVPVSTDANVAHTLLLLLPLPLLMVLQSCHLRLCLGVVSVLQHLADDPELSARLSMLQHLAPQVSGKAWTRCWSVVGPGVRHSLHEQVVKAWV